MHNNSAILDAPPTDFALLEDGIAKLSILSQKEILEAESRQLSTTTPLEGGSYLPFPTVACINAHGPTNAPSANSEMRKALLKQIIDSTQPDIAFTQEVQWVSHKFIKHVPVHGSERDYEYSGVVYESGILYNPTQFEFQKLPDKPRKHGLTSRIHFGTLTPCSTGVFGHMSAFIAMSYHGPHSGHNASQKKELCRNVITFARELAERHKMPVLIGGDWNYDLSSVPAEEPWLVGAIIPTYNPVRRFEQVIDWFCLIPYEPGQQHCKIKNVRAAEIYQDNSELNNKAFTTPQLDFLQQKSGRDDYFKYKYALDHDPLFATFEFRSPLL